MFGQISTARCFGLVCAREENMPRIKFLEERPYGFPGSPPAGLTSSSGWDRPIPGGRVPSGHSRGSPLGWQPLTSGCPRPGWRSRFLTWRRPLGPPQITQLKIDNNPFAKGFRDTGNGRREKR